jgi:hypothetical protein
MLVLEAARGALRGHPTVGQATPEGRVEHRVLGDAPARAGPLVPVESPALAEKPTALEEHLPLAWVESLAQVGRPHQVEPLAWAGPLAQAGPLAEMGLSRLARVGPSTWAEHQARVEFSSQMGPSAWAEHQALEGALQADQAGRATRGPGKPTLPILVVRAA